MMKRKVNKKSIIRIVVAAIFFSIFGLILFITSRTKPVEKSLDSFCYDEIHLFTDIQIEEINNACYEVQQKNNLNVYVLTCKRRGSFAEKDGVDFLFEHKLSLNDTLAIIIINAYSNIEGTIHNDYHFDIYTYGESEKRITDNEIDNILYCNGGDLILTSSASNAATGLKECISKIGTAYSFILCKSWTAVCIVSAIIGIVIAIIIINIIKKLYSKHRDVNNYSFKNNTNLSLDICEDIFITKHVTCVVIQSSSSSSSGGGHSSGGGGGAGHRGGR